MGSNVTGIYSTNAAPTTVSSQIQANAAGTTLLASGAGAMTISGGIGGSGNLILDNNFTTAAGINITTTAVGNLGAIINSGTGSGGVTISTAINANVNAVTQNSATSPLTLSGSLTSSYGNYNNNGIGLTINAGTVVISTTTSVNALGNYSVILGNTANTGSNATLQFNGSGSFPAFANNIVVTGNGVDTISVTSWNPVFNGTLTLSNSLALLINNGGGSNMTFNGAISGSGNITATANNNQANNYFVFGAGGINNIGSLSFLTMGGTTVTLGNQVTGAIGPNVTNVIQNNPYSSLLLSGANSQAATTITAGTLIVSNTAGSATGTGPVALNGGVLASGVVGTIAGTVTAGTAAINQVAPGGIGSIGTLNVGSLITSGSTTLNFDLSPSGGSNDLLNVTGGTLSFAPVPR